MDPKITKQKNWYLKLILYSWFSIRSLSSLKPWFQMKRLRQVMEQTMILRLLVTYTSDLNMFSSYKKSKDYYKIDKRTANWGLTWMTPPWGSTTSFTLNKVMPGTFRSWSRWHTNGDDKFYPKKIYPKKVIHK